MQITKQLTLDVSKENLIKPIEAKQYDTGSRFLQIRLTDSGKPIEIDSGVTVTINATRADGQSKSYFGTVNEDHTITVPITYWMLELDDAVSCDISLVDADGNRLTSMSFTVWVEAANFGGGETEEGSQKDILFVLQSEIQYTRRYAENLNKGTLEATIKALVTKLDRITEDHKNAAVVYIQSPTGTEEFRELRVGNTGTSVMQRDDAGRSKISDPKDPLDISNKQYADTKVPKYTKEHKAYGVAYYQKPNGEEAVVPINTVPNPSTLVYRSKTGTAQVEDPVDDKDIVNMEFAEGRYIRRVPNDTEDLQLYCERSNSTGQIAATAGNVTNSIIQRDSAGRAQISDPESNLDISNKQYVDTLLTNKANINPNPDQYKRALTSYKSGNDYIESYMRVASGCVNNTIVSRDTSGYFEIKTPTNDNHPANKKFVEDTFKSYFTAGMMHKNFYRGTSLGDHITAAQLETIQSGEFEDIFVGDYWNMGGLLYTVLDFDYYYNTGNAPFQNHHLVVAPYEPLGAAQMNPSRTTAGGYALSEFRTTSRTQIENMVHTDFYGHVLTYQNLFVNEVSSDGVPIATDWYEATVELMTEQQVYGAKINGLQGEVNARRTLDTQQFAAFRLNMQLYKNMQNCWLRDVASDEYFASIGENGASLCSNADSTLCVRPYFLIG